MLFDLDEFAGSRVVYASVPVDVLSMRTTSFGRIADVAADALTGLVALVFGVYGILAQRPAVTRIGRIVEPSLRGHPDANASFFAQLDQPCPLAHFPGATAGLPNCPKSSRVVRAYRLALRSTSR